MSKLTKKQAKAHAESCDLLTKEVLTYDERVFVIENWQESASHINSAAGAFFTPLELAHSFAIEVSGGAAENCRIIDLCAGIGALSFAVHDYNTRNPVEIVCIEKNPDYVAVGRKVVPEATWICADVFDLPADLGRFTFAISNPPFGSGGPIKGLTLDLNVVAVASKLAEFGVFILPVNSCGFEYSGRPFYKVRDDAQYKALVAKTGIILGASCGIDCSFAKGMWRGVAPAVEIAVADFSELAAGAQADLFAVAAE